MRLAVREKKNVLVVGSTGSGKTTLVNAILDALASIAPQDRVRLENLVAEATSAPQQNLIAEAIDLVVFIDEESDLAAGRKVRELLVVTGYDSSRYAVEYV
ncbi:MAG: Flp pilus assembly complex ATPase component TadA [Bryobacteraceae bacterium]|nr:Flp pilus assembly complex ATPase component TadA [Bryobacteraceae bacterium]